MGLGPWALRGVTVGGKPSRLVVWVSSTEVLAYCEPGVGFNVPVAVQTLGGDSGVVEGGDGNGQDGT